MRHGRVNFGGLETGTRDRDATATVQRYVAAFGGRPRPCAVASTADGEPERIMVVSPADAPGAPACQDDGTMPFF